jgi:hypothetical protein
MEVGRLAADPADPGWRGLPAPPRLRSRQRRHLPPRPRGKDAEILARFARLGQEPNVVDAGSESFHINCHGCAPSSVPMAGCSRPVVPTSLSSGRWDTQLTRSPRRCSVAARDSAFLARFLTFFFISGPLLRQISRVAAPLYPRRTKNLFSWALQRAPCRG